MTQNILDKICEACKPVCFLPEEESKFMTLERTSKSGHFICSKTNTASMHYQCYMITPKGRLRRITKERLEPMKYLMVKRLLQELK